MNLHGDTTPVLFYGTSEARVADADEDGKPYSVIQDDNGDILGVNVSVLIVNGPFAQKACYAQITCEIGQRFPSVPAPGSTVLVSFTSGDVNSGVYVTRQVCGGPSSPIPKAAAGIAVDDDGLASNYAISPGKGVAIRLYALGAPIILRVKGKVPADESPTGEAYMGEIYLEADDASDDPDGKNGTYMRIMYDPTTKKMAWKARDASGASLTLLDGIGIMQSPNGLNQIRVGDDGVFISATAFNVTATSYNRIDGLTMVNCPPGLPPLPIMSAIRGTSGVSGLPSLGLYIGQ